MPTSNLTTLANSIDGVQFLALIVRGHSLHAAVGYRARHSDGHMLVGEQPRSPIAGVPISHVAHLAEHSESFHFCR